jgi:hypothetical protein
MTLSPVSVAVAYVESAKPTPADARIGVKLLLAQDFVKEMAHG